MGHLLVFAAWLEMQYSEMLYSAESIMQESIISKSASDEGVK